MTRLRTRRIGGIPLRLIVGKRYVALREAVGHRNQFDTWGKRILKVSIVVHRARNRLAEHIGYMRYEEANDFVNRFNDGKQGRIWR